MHRKQSVASISGTKTKEVKRNSTAGKQGAYRHKAVLIREMETKWYLKMFGMGKEETVAHKTGMPYRSVKPCECVDMCVCVRERDLK